MKNILFLLVFILLGGGGAWAGDGIAEKLGRISRISGVEKLKVAPFEEYYRFWFEQPVDHTDPSKGTFRQQVLLGHRKADAPVIVELEGYAVWKQGAGELTDLLKGNQVTIEHRFFDRSVPEGGIPWDYLTIRQAAADQHEIIRALRENLYPSVPWISTGISKGGQTTVFHRYFYPEDVDISVPYVAPLNLDYVDPRLEKFLERLGSSKTKSRGELFAWDNQNSVHWMIRDFQLLCFKNQDTLVTMLKALADEKGYTYETVGGIERALQLIILEYPFAFWQWGSSPAGIPDEESAEWEEIFDYLTKVSTPDFFEDKYIERMRPFFYAALTETGMYDYNIKPFKKYLTDDKKNIDFSFTLPQGVTQKPFNKEQMQDINKWLQTDAEKILFIYGGSDPWYATGVDLKNNPECRKYVRGDMSHSCRIKDFDPVSREDLMDTLQEWLREVQAKYNNH